MKTLSWVVSIPAVGIMWMTLYFKFSGAEESVRLFSQLGIEPWGRYATGIAELIAGALLLYPRLRHLGALLGFGIMGGALLSHLLVLGIEVNKDGGLLFLYACIVFLCCLTLLLMNRKKLKPGKWLGFEA